MGDSTPPFVTISSRQPVDGNIFSSGDSAVRRDNKTARPQARSRLITSTQYGSSVGDEKTPAAATHDTSRVNYHVKNLPEFAKTLEDSATRAFPNRGSSQRYKKVYAILLHWSCDDLFVLPELEDLETCFREDYNFETETFSIPSENAHLELMLKIGATIKEHESNDTLIIVYYGGHARIDESRQSTWCANRSSDSPWLQWSAIQTLLERSLSDVLILLDCCAGAASATFPNGNSITETISASSWDAIAPDPGRYSFTSALIEILQQWRMRTFSAAMLHAEVLARLKHPRPIMLNGKQFEARSTPVHFMMTANHKAPSIELSRVVSPNLRPPSPPQEPLADPGAANGRSGYPQDIANTEPNEDVPHVMISLALEDDQRLNINDWEQWLSSIPALAKYVKVQGVFKSHSTLLLLSLPVMVWDLLPENHACNFIAFIRSNNLVAQDRKEPQLVEEEVSTGADLDADRTSIYSGTTAYTGSVRFSTISNPARSPIEAPYRTLERPRHELPMRSHRSKPSTTLEGSPFQAWPSSTLGPPTRHRTAPVGGSLYRSVSNDNIARHQFMPQPRTSRKASNVPQNIPGPPDLPPRVQARLEEYFHNNPRPTVAVKEFLASNLGIETADIDIWFYHRREQQEVSNRLQSLKIDDHSHDRPKDGAQMILPGHLNKLLEIFPTGQIVMIDLRSEAEYERSHIHGAINFRVPASFVSKATMEMIERALPDESSRSSFNKWYTSKCVVFYDKVVEYAWEAPVVEELFQKFKSKGWTGQCFVLKGHYREFSHSFDKYIVGTNTTDNAKEYLASLQDVSWEKSKDDHQRYDDWVKLLEDEDRVYSTDLVPAVKDERIQAMVKQQEAVEEEFKRAQPSLYQMALDRKLDDNWSIKTPMVEHLERGLVKMQEASVLGIGRGRGGSVGGTGGSGRHSSTPPDFRLGHRGYPTTSENKLSTVEDYDLLESEDEHPIPAVQHEPGFQKVGSTASLSAASKASADDASTGGNDQKSRRPTLGGGRSLLTKFIRSGRPDTPR
ncbi:hypothetical protein F4809DRAFT_648157 [Biscogniauxia mediterranea]|nr:hypothetical protein F4809DRAFT_648157 [Biscogniauxia mediterranea]